jgi:uncharacterized membrane protein
MTRTTTKDRRSRRPRTTEDEPRRSNRRDFEDEERTASADDEGDDVGSSGRDEGSSSDSGSSSDGGSAGGVFAELKNVASDAALAVLAPVAKKAATGAAKYAVKKAPELLEDTVKPMLEDAGGVKGLVGQAMSSDGPAGGMLSKLMPGGDDGDGGGGNAGDGTGKGRRLPVQQSVDVAAPIDIVYDQWTQFEDYPKFMHRVKRVEQRDETHVAFHAKVWGINRMWEAEIVEQRPDERIVFKSVNGVQLTGVVTFHDMAERLTRIELNVDVDPDGPIEKIARGTRAVKRAARSDLKRFKAYVEMHEDETGAWRGEIEDGDVVSEPGDDASEDEYYDDERAEASYDEDEATDEMSEDEPPDGDGDEDEEEPEAPRKTASSNRKSRSNGSDPGKSRSRAKSTNPRSRGSKNGSSGSGSGSSRKRASTASSSRSSKSQSSRGKASSRRRSS